MKFGTLRITTVDGRQREYPLDLPSIVIGRADGNAIVIDDLSVARRHARAFFDSGRLMLEDLGSAEGTYIDGQRLTPGTPGLVEPASEIRFGDVSARYEPPAEPEEPEYEHGTTTPALPAVPPATGIGVRLAVGNEPLLPGSGGLTAEITVHNRGNVVDEFDIAVTGISPSWLILSTPRVGLLPGAETTVLLTIQPPRHSDAVAGDHPFDVTITSETTGQSATESGTLRILGFNGLVLTIEPPRGRRDFVLVAGNDGNVTETLALSGVDDEDAFDYTFRQDVLVVPPGREERLPFRVKPRKRALFGRETIVPFNVVAKPETGEVEAIPAAGQLVVHPPLEPLKRPVLFSLVLIVLGIATFGVFLFSNDSGTKAASPEAAYAGVHMCDKGNQPKNAQAPVSNANKASAVLGTTSDAIPAVAQTGPVIQQQQGDSGGPYFAQNDPRWANVEYAKAGDPDFGPDWCGTTIAQCGCAMTSVTTIMALFNIITMPDGEPLTPKTVNDWFNLNARKTVRGWVSQGYIYGDVIWTAANQLSGEIAAKYPGTRTLRFARTGTGSDAEIKAELRAGRPIVLEVPGHWIAAVGLDGDTILINDPFYRDRKTLDAYAGKVKSSVLFEPSNDLSAVVITVPADTRIRVTDKQGRVVGTLDTTSAQDAAKNAKTEIPGASYSTRQAWRDPTCVESAPPVGAGTNQIVLPGSRDDYKIEVLETTGGPTSVSIHTYDKNGQPTVQTIDNDTGGVTASMSFDPTKGKADVSIVGGKPVEEDSSARSAGKTAQAQAASPSPSPSPSATASATPSAGPGGLTTTTLSVSVPAGTKEIAVSSQNGFSIGDLIRISPGQANEEDATIAAFGSFILTTPLKFAHSAGEPVVRLGGAPPGTGGAGGTPGGSQGPPKTEVVPPDSVALTCSVVYSDSPRTATLVCSAAIGGVFTTTRWTVDGSVRAEISGKTVFLATYTHDGLTSISVSACNQTLCKSDSTTQTIRFPAAPGQPTPTVAPPPPTPVVPTVTPPAVGAALNCGYLIDTTTVAGGQAQVTCLAQTKESLTSFTFQTEDLTPGSTTLVSASSTDASGARTYKFDGTAAPNDLTPTNQQATVTVGGEACTLSSCSTVSPAMLTIPYANVSLSVLPATVPLGTSVNLFAVITGPNGLVPAGGTVQFAAIDTSGSTPVTVPIGLEVKVSPVGGFAVANLTVPTGQMPLSNTQAYKIIAVYSGGANMFGGTSPQQNLSVTPKLPDICNGFDDNGNGQIDESCVVLGDSGASDKDIGAAVIMRSVTMTSGNATSGSGTSSIVVSPGASLTVAGTVLLNTEQPETCIDCVRQVYFGIGENTAVFPQVAPVGPYCAMSQRLPDPTVDPAPVSLPQSGHNVTIKAPTVPGIYYLRSTASIQANCGNPPVGGPDVSVGRIIVQAATTTTLDPLTPNLQLGNEFSLSATVNATRPPGGVADPEGMLPGYVVFCDADMPSENGTTNPWCDAHYKLGMVPVVSVTGAGQKPSGVARLVVDSGTYYQLAQADPSLFQDPRWQNPLETHHITASYLAYPDGPSAGRFTPTYPTPVFTGSDSAEGAFVLNPARTEIGIDVNPATVPLGGIVNLVAALSSPPQFGPLNGSVSFMAGTTQLACTTTNTSGLELARVAYDTANIYSKFPTSAVDTYHITANYRAGIDCTGNPDGVSNYMSVSTSPPSSCSPTQPGCLTVTPAASKATLALTPTGTTSLGDSAFSASVALAALPANTAAFGDFGGALQMTCDGTDLGSPTSIPAATNPVPITIGWTDIASLCGSPLAGQHVLGVRYIPGSGSFYGPATAPGVGYSFTAVTTTTTVDVPSATTTNLGGKVTITATVVAQTAIGEPFGPLTGTVEFLVGTAVIGSGPTGFSAGSTNASCECDTGLIYGAVPSPIGDQTVTARYVSTSTNYLGSTSATGATVTIDPETTVISTTVSAATVPLGGPVTITATISARRNFGAFAGTVHFYDGNAGTTEIGTVPVTQIPNNPAGTATLEFNTSQFYALHPGSAVGTHTITASFVAASGGNYANVNDATGATLTVTPAPTSVTLSANPAAATKGASVTLTAQVGPRPFGNVTSGSVVFKEGANTLAGATAIDGSTGIATVTIPNIAAGPHTYTAHYDNGGSGNYASSTTDGSVNVSVLWPTVTTITVPTTQVVAGPSTRVILSTTVTCPQCGGSTPVSGTVEFFDGVTSLGTATLLNGSTSIQVNVPSSSPGPTDLTVGQHPSLAVRYYGDPANNFAPSDSPLAQLTIYAPTTTTIAASSTTANPGSGSTLTVTVSSPYTGTDITGNVEISDSAWPGKRWTVAVNKNGSTFEAVQAYLPPTSDAVGDRTFTAKFVPAGGSLFIASTTVSGVTVKVQHRTQVTLSASPTTVTWGAASPGGSSTLTATLQDTDASNAPIPNTSSIEFYARVGGTGPKVTLNAGSTDGSGVATFVYTPPDAQNEAVSAAFIAGTGSNYLTSTESTPTTIVVNPAPTTITMNLSSTSVQYATDIPITGHVSSTSTPAPASGSVAIYDSGTQIGTASVDSSGNYSFSTSVLGSPLAVGGHPISARFLAGGNYAQSPIQGPTTLTITTITTTISATATVNTTNKKVTINVTMNPNSNPGGTFAGTMSFVDDHATHEINTSGIAVPLNGVVSWTSASVASGTYTVTITYVPGSGSNYAGSSTVTAAFTVPP